VNYTIKNASRLRGTKIQLAVNNLANNHNIVGVTPATAATAAAPYVQSSSDLVELAARAQHHAYHHRRLGAEKVVAFQAKAIAPGRGWYHRWRCPAGNRPAATARHMIQRSWKWPVVIIRPEDASNTIPHLRRERCRLPRPNPAKRSAILSLAYTPGVAVPCLEIARDPSLAYKYTAKATWLRW